jgi:hypothetical protein
MRRRVSILTSALLVGVTVFAIVPAPAVASKVITDNPHHVRLRVDRHGVAMVEYIDRSGRHHHVLAWGAKNAIAPDRNRKQRHFKLDYSGGSGSFGRGYWKTLRNACDHFPTAREFAAATGQEPLPLYVAGCRARNGSLWALQAWKRLVPHGGLYKRDYRRARLELHLSHWDTALPVLAVHTDWVYGGKFDHLWGRFTYLGVPVHGFGATNTGNPTDAFGRNLYVDTLDPKWGRGWWRLQAFLTHRPAGNFCVGTYTFGRTTPGMGKAYRGTIMGPGVTPVVRVRVPQPGPYDPAADAASNAQQKALAPPGDSCNNTH